MASIAEPPPAFRFHIPKLFSLSEKCRLKKIYSKLKKKIHKLNEVIYIQSYQNVNFKTYFHRLMRNNEKNSYKFPEQFTFTLWSGCPWNVGKMIFFTMSVWCHSVISFFLWIIFTEIKFSALCLLAWWSYRRFHGFLSRNSKWLALSSTCCCTYSMHRASLLRFNYSCLK